MLNIPEELYLLALDEEKGVLREMPGMTLDAVLSGGLLMELALRGLIDTDLDTLHVVGEAPTNDPLLDETMAAIRGVSDSRSPSDWLKQFACPENRLRERILERLSSRGILREESRRVFWLFRDTRHFPVDDRATKETRGRLKDLVMSDEIPDARDAVLLSLISAGRLWDSLLTPFELTARKNRIEALSKLELVGRSIVRSLCEIESAMAMSMAVPH